MTPLTEAAADAYLSGWAISGGPFTQRTHAGLIAAAETVLEHRHDPGVLEAALELGKLEGTWALVYDRREALLRKHLKAVAAAWAACTAGLDPRDVARAFRRDAYLATETATKDPQKKWWQDVAVTAALGWLRSIYHTDGYSHLVAAVEDAIRSGMAEGEADALALAASRQGRAGFRIDAAFKAAYARLASGHTIGQQAADVATRMIDGAARDTGNRLAALAGDGASEDEMTAGAADAVSAQRAPSRWTQWALWSGLGQGGIGLYARAQQTLNAGSGNGSDVTVLIDWNTDGNPCIACEQNEQSGPYAPIDVPPYPGHPNCKCWLSSAAGLPDWLLASFLAGDD